MLPSGDHDGATQQPSWVSCRAWGGGVGDGVGEAVGVGRGVCVGGAAVAVAVGWAAGLAALPLLAMGLPLVVVGPAAGVPSPAAMAFEGGVGVDWQAASTRASAAMTIR